jgi:uncharacterized spore protein YtfJ
LTARHVEAANAYIVVVDVVIVGLSFMQGIYTYIPEKIHVPREHCGGGGGGGGGGVVIVVVVILLLLSSSLSSLSSCFLS